MEISYILVAVGGFVVGVVWGFNLLIAITRRKKRKGETPKLLEKLEDVKK